MVGAVGRKSPRGESAGGRPEFHQGLNKPFEIMVMMNCDVRAPEARGARCEVGRGAKAGKDCVRSIAESGDFGELRLRGAQSSCRAVRSGERIPPRALLWSAGAPTTAREGACAPHLEMKWSYRFVPLGTGWYRLVPDKFFCRQSLHPIWKRHERSSGLAPNFPLSVGCAASDGLAPTSVGGYLMNGLLSGRRWDYAGGYAGISGRKTGRFPLNPA